MRKELLVVFILILGVLFLHGEAEFSAEQRSFDFGEIYEKDGKVSHKFIFRNTGDEPLIIIDVHAS